jgi:F0F1-type ATP synthase assembly protein I
VTAEEFFDWVKLLFILIGGVMVGAFIGVFAAIWVWFSLMV